MQIGEVTAPATGHQNFLADLVRAFQHQHLPAPLARGHGAHQPGGPAANDNDIVIVRWCIVHQRNITASTVVMAG